MQIKIPFLAIGFLRQVNEIFTLRTDLVLRLFFANNSSPNVCKFSCPKLIHYKLYPPPNYRKLKLHFFRG
jgi:hypothetical protein